MNAKLIRSGEISLDRGARQQADRTLAWLANISCGLDSKGRRVVGGKSAHGIDHAERGDLYHSLLSKGEDDEDAGEQSDDVDEGDGDEDVSVIDTGGDGALSDDGELMSVQQERARKNYLTASRTRAQRANAVALYCFVYMRTHSHVCMFLRVCVHMHLDTARAGPD